MRVSGPAVVGVAVLLAALNSAVFIPGLSPLQSSSRVAVAARSPREGRLQAIGAPAAEEAPAAASWTPPAVIGAALPALLALGLLFGASPGSPAWAAAGPAAAPVVVSVRQSPVLAEQGSSLALAAAEKVDWARSLASGASAGFKTVGEVLPKAEEAVEQQLPALKAPAAEVARAASGVTQANAGDKAVELAPAVAGFVAKGAEVTVRLGLQAGSWGLKVTADNLPAIGSAVQAAAVQATPVLQSGLHASAELLNRTEPGSLQPLLKGLARGLDFVADGAPAAESFVAYGAGQAVPVAQSALGAASRVSADVAKLPLPDAGQVAKSLKAAGLDPERLASGAQSLAQQVAARRPGA